MCSSLNAFGAMVSTPHLSMKFPSTTSYIITIHEISKITLEKGEGMNGVLEKFNKFFAKSKLFHKQICKTHVQTVSSDDRKIVLANHDFVVY